MGITQSAGSAIIDSKMHTRTTKPTVPISYSYTGATMGRKQPSGLEAVRTSSTVAGTSSREGDKISKGTTGTSYSSSSGYERKQVPIPSQITNQRFDYPNNVSS